MKRKRRPGPASLPCRVAESVLIALIKVLKKLSPKVLRCCSAVVAAVAVDTGPAAVGWPSWLH
jgi:hypothetical protein